MTIDPQSSIRRPQWAAFVLAMLALGLSGCGVPSFLVTPVSSSSTLEEETVRAGSGWFPKKVVIIEIEGLLVNAKTGGFLQPTENDLSRFTQQMKKAEEDKDVAAVVLRINSPGGTVTTSDTMYQRILKFKEKTGRPVIASTQEVAASGAYYIACAADKIVVHPTSVVGSIGVVFNTFDFSGTMAKIGARSEAIKSGPLKDMGSPFHPLSDAERAVMQKMVDEYYARFVNIVKTRRPVKDGATLALVTDGRVVSGQSAIEYGLADQAGTLDDAIELAERLAGVSDAEVVLYKRPYAYSGSIYAGGATQPPQMNVINIDLPPLRAMLPSGFYYIWEP